MNYRLISKFGLIFFIGINCYSAQAATMRCSGNIVSEGELTIDVARKCGQPSDRQIINPSINSDGYVVKGAVAVETWVYGPNNGMSQYLRFIDGKLVEIRSKMN